MGACKGYVRMIKDLSEQFMSGCVIEGIEYFLQGSDAMADISFVNDQILLKFGIFCVFVIEIPLRSSVHEFVIM